MGERIIAGRYALGAEVGRGGMGAVWRGTDTVLGRTVALKRIGIAPGGATPDSVRAEREARLAARLNHPHVVAVYDLTVDRGEQWLVMEYVDGTDLAELIRSQGSLSPDQVAPILAQTASALAAAHAGGIVHRDVKPSNILVTAGGQVKLSDFGIARTQADAALTQTGLVTGSPAYLSPEVASGHQATPASDVWSLGATLFHALEGHPPYDLGENLIGGLYRIVHEEPPRPSRPGWLAPMPPGTMTHEPSRRWTAAQLQTFLHGRPGAPPPPRAGTGRLPSSSPGSPTGTHAGRYADAGLGTQVLAPVGRSAAPGGPADPGPPAGPRPDRRRRGRRVSGWVLALVALVVVAVAVAGLAIGLRRDGPVTGAAPEPSSSGSTAPASDRPPTAAAMTDFLRSYLELAVSDPSRAFGLLTPAYQERSDGETGYLSFWGAVTSATLLTDDPDPATLVVAYTYRYERAGGRPRTETLRMQLQYADGKYLIAGQS